MEPHGFPFCSMEIAMDFHGSPWSSTGLHGVAGFHGVPWCSAVNSTEYSMGLHGYTPRQIPWKGHGISMYDHYYFIGHPTIAGDHSIYIFMSFSPTGSIFVQYET